MKKHLTLILGAITFTFPLWSYDLLPALQPSNEGAELMIVNNSDEEGSFHFRVLVTQMDKNHQITHAKQVESQLFLNPHEAKVVGKESLTKGCKIWATLDPALSKNDENPKNNSTVIDLCNRGVK